jgi:hypothetical protein
MGAFKVVGTSVLDVLAGMVAGAVVLAGWTGVQRVRNKMA